MIYLWITIKFTGILLTKTHPNCTHSKRVSKQAIFSTNYMCVHIWAFVYIINPPNLIVVILPITYWKQCSTSSGYLSYYTGLSSAKC